MSHNTNKRIAQNTLFLYFRTLVILLVSLYTSRVVLNVLGIDDYCIYNVVGGIVLMFQFLNVGDEEGDDVGAGVGGFVVGQFEDWMFVNVGFDD